MRDVAMRGVAMRGVAMRGVAMRGLRCEMLRCVVLRCVVLRCEVLRCEVLLTVPTHDSGVMEKFLCSAAQSLIHSPTPNMHAPVTVVRSRNGTNTGTH